MRMMPPTKKSKYEACEYAWESLCEKDGVPCPGIQDCRHVDEEMLCVPLKSGMKIVAKLRRYHPL